MNILLAEDDLINQKIASFLLEKSGHHVLVAANGVEAVDAVKTGDFDLVLMDVQMPEMDGYQATRAIRALGGAKAAIPIVALTASCGESDLQACTAAGMNEVLTKPIRVEQLNDVIQRLVKS